MSHYLIRIIAEGDTPKEAVENAENYADYLVEKGDFDYHKSDGMWDNIKLGKARSVNSREGSRLIDDAMKGSRREFDIALTHARYMLDHYTPDQIYEEEFGTQEQQNEIRKENKDIYYLSRYMFSKLDGGMGTSYLYADGNVWGGAIESEKALKHVLNEGKKLWVVAFDMHN